MSENGTFVALQKKKAKAYMTSKDPEGKLAYHSWNHVNQVVIAVEDMLQDYNFEPEHQEDMVLAAIWHDAEYAKGKAGHEKRSAAMARETLKAEGLSEERLDRIERLILSTQIDAVPAEEDERIMRDADLSHLGSPNYMTFYNDLFEEINTYSERPMTEVEWRKMCIDFTENAKYHTKAGQKRYQQIKQENIKRLKAMTEIIPTPGGDGASKADQKRLKKERKKNAPKFRTEKGIETMFRVQLRNHISLSQIADQKANTLISVNAIILSIVLSALFPKLDSNPWLLLPGLSLILVSIATIIMATLSTIPKTTQGAVTEVDVKNKKGNLLFFGNFHKMSLQEYEWGVGELMKDGEYLYSSLTRDLYFLGLVLNKKYSLLRYGYLVFVIGLLISIALFIWSVVFMSPGMTL